MKRKVYFLTTFILFIALTSVHFLRLVLGWEVNIGGGTMPMWLSWLVVLGIGYLAYNAFKLYKKQ